MSDRAIMNELRTATQSYPEWADYAALLDDENVGIHIAVMLEPFFSYLLDGKKTIESRFSKNAVAPYGKIAEGDLVFLKAGPVAGVFRASKVESITLRGDALDRLRVAKAKAICAEDDDFWAARADKRYATLIGVTDVRALPPVTIPKRDMRGWVVLNVGASLQKRPAEQPSLW